MSEWSSTHFEISSSENTSIPFCPPAHNRDLQSTSDCTLTELEWQKWSRWNNKWLETQNFTCTVFLDLFIAITACNLIAVCSSIS